jgi:hypothetical protein
MKRAKAAQEKQTQKAQKTNEKQVVAQEKKTPEAPKKDA